MEIKTQHIVTPKTARYTSYGKLSSKTKYFWFVLHGSNMLSEQMLYKFKDFDKIFTYGSEDQFLNYKKITEIQEICKAGNLNFHEEVYTGDHRVDKKQLKKIFKQYIEQ